ncbi:MAG: methyltransferase domain-containing protein [Bacteroidota bacterium]
MVNLAHDYWKLIELRDSAPDMPILNVVDDADMWHLNPTTRLILDAIGNSAAILDVGAGDKRLEKALRSAGWNGTYESIDIECSVKHDYRSFQEVSKKYGAVFMLELIEHMPLSEGLEYFELAQRCLEDPGVLIVSTPNINSINRLWRTDVTHIQQYPPRDLYAILRMTGFHGTIQGYRIILSPRKNTRRVKYAVKSMLKRSLCRILEVDYTDGIFFIARNR